MKIFGRLKDDDSGLVPLADINLVAESDTLRELASFLYRCADEIENSGDEWEQDYFECNDAVSPQVTVFNPSLVSQEDGEDEDEDEYSED